MSAPCAAPGPRRRKRPSGSLGRVGAHGAPESARLERKIQEEEDESLSTRLITCRSCPPAAENGAAGSSRATACRTGRSDQACAAGPRYGAAGNRVSVEHAGDFRPRPMERARYREPAAVDFGFRGLELVAIGIDLDQRRRSNLVEQKTVGLIRKWSCCPGTRAVMRVLTRSDHPNRSTRR